MSGPGRKTSPGGLQEAAEAPSRTSHLGYVAHEIRNPVSTALWTAELLARLPAAERGGARGEKLAAICLRSMARVRLLVEDHLLCERLDAGGYPTRPEPLPLGEVGAAVLGRLGAEAGRVKMDGLDGLRVHADRALLERSLEGVIAVALEGESAVHVAARTEGGQVLLRVEGAPARSLADPGRGHPSEQRGRALALPMARRAAEATGGRLEVDGAAYRLAIPLA